MGGSVKDRDHDLRLNKTQVVSDTTRSMEGQMYIEINGEEKIVFVNKKL